MVKMQVTYFTLIFLLLALPNSAELSHQASRLAENLGMLLGLPLDLDVPRGNVSSVPDFLMSIYNCWTTLGSSGDRSSCLPVHDTVDKERLEDVNVVRSIKGTAVQSGTPGVFSHTPEETVLPTSLSLNFNMSLMQRLKEDIRYAYIRVPKTSLTAEKQEYVKNQCNENEGIPLELLVKVNTTEDSRGVFSLLSRTVLPKHDIGQEKLIEFGDITSQFKDWLEESISSKTFEVVETRIIVGAGDCYNHINPAELGISQSTSESSFIIVYSKSDNSEDAIIKAGLAELAAEATANRQRRNIEEHGSEGNSESTQLSDNVLQFNISNYHLHPCRRYSHTISFAELGWSDYILRPESYEANFCAGSCDYPLTGQYNTTKHSYIQSLAAKLNPGLVPPPCCAPHELRPLTVLYEQARDSYITYVWHGMRAESCGCK